MPNIPDMIPKTPERLLVTVDWRATHSDVMDLLGLLRKHPAVFSYAAMHTGPVYIPLKEKVED